MRRQTVLLSWMLASGAALPAYAQPYGWFPTGNALTAINLATGATVFSQSAPPGITVGQGDIDPLTGDYLAITNVGTFRVQVSPPSIKSEVIPVAGTALHVSADAALGLVPFTGDGVFGQRLVRLADGAELARYDRALEARFDPTGILIVSSGIPDTYRLRRYARSAPTTPLWTLDLGTAYTIPRATAVGVLVKRANRLQKLDAVTGAVMQEVESNAIAFETAGNAVYAQSYAEFTKYDLETFAKVASVPNSDLSGPRSMEFSRDGGLIYIYISDYAGRTGYITRLVTRDAADLRVLTTRSAPANSYLKVSHHAACRLEMSPAGSTGMALDAPARGGVVEVRVDATGRCDPWNAELRSDWNAVLLGTTTRTGSSTVQVAVPPRNRNFQPQVSSVLNVAGVWVWINQVLETALPNPPVAVRGRQSGSSATIEWTVDEGPDITGFQIEAGLSGGPVQLLVERAASARSWTAPSLPPGNYFVQVRAVNAVGKSSAAGPVSFSVAPSRAPAAPTNLRIAAANSYVRLDWDAPASANATHFVIEGGRSGAARTVLGQTPDARPTFTFTNVPPDLWQFAVRAVNDAGASAPSNVVTVTTTSCSAPPTPPSSFRATVTENVVSLTWDIPSSGADDVVIEAGTVPGATDITRVKMPASLTGIDQEVPAGAYVLRLRAQNACGQSPPSVERIIAVRP